MTLPEQMRATWYERQGPAVDVIQHGTMPVPAPAAGELLVAVAYSSVNPTDCNGRSGTLGRTMAAPRVVPNSDGSGVVVAIGAGVDADWLNRRVWMHCVQRTRPIGTGAEFTAVPVALCAPLPDEATLRQGACLGIPAMTAWMALFQDGDLRGKTVLVTGGAGAVGHYAVQMARHAGARVLATASGEAKIADARAAGAESAIDYKRDDVTEAVLACTDGNGIDLLCEVDFGLGLEAGVRMLRNGGTIATYSSLGEPRPLIDAYALMRKNINCRFLLTAAPPPGVRERAQRWIGEWLRDDASAIHRVSTVLPLACMAQAHGLVETGTRRGAVLVELAGESVA